MSTITLYDVQSTLKEKTISPSSGKLRLYLDFKKIPFETAWIDFPEIEVTAKTVGAPATGTRADGNPAYTIPFITVSSPNEPSVAISNAHTIAEYLEKLYPDPEHKLLSAGTRVFQSIFTKYLASTIQSAMAKVTIVPLARALPAHTQEWYLETRGTFYGKHLLESLPKDEAAFAQAWKAFEDAFDDLAAHLDKSGEGNYRVTGDVSFSEFELVALLHIVRKLVYEEGWKKRLAVRNGGRWTKILNLPLYKELLPGY